MEIKTDVSFLKSVRCSDVYTESQADYVLPDYLGDVRKILFTEASLRPSGRFAGSDEVEFSGVVVYNLIYLDGEGGLCSAEFTSDYDYSVKCSGESYIDSIADTRILSYSIRLIGPRKVSAKATLSGSVRLSENGTAEAVGNGFDAGFKPEIDKGSVKIHSSRLSSTVEREYAEGISSIEGGIADEVKVIYSCVEPTVDDIRPGEDRVTLKGKLRMCAVVRNGDEPAYSVERILPFEEDVEFEGITNNTRLLPQIYVSSVRTEVNADENGCQVVMSCILEYCVAGEENQQVDLLMDGYLRECPTDNGYRDFGYSCLVDAVTARCAHTAEMSRADIESGALREIVFVAATPKVDRIEKENGRISIFGEVRYSGIASEMIEDKISYVPIRFSSEFSANVNLDCQNCQNLTVNAELHATSAIATLDSERLYLSCNIECSAILTEDKSQRILSSMSRRVGESYENEGAKITVYYPTSSDTLFSVAKRFHTSTLKLAEDNNITQSVFSSDNPSGSLSGVKKLIVY